MQTDPRSSLTEKIADCLANEIIRGTRAPNSRIQEMTLAKQLGVSRGSVREALLVLERRHLIEILPRRGAIVTDFSSEEMRQFSELYVILQKRLFNLCSRHTRAMRTAFEDSLKALADAQLAADSAAFARARAEFMEAALRVADDHYLDRVLRPLLAVAGRLSARAARHPEFQMDSVALYYRGLVEAMLHAPGERIDQLIASFNQQELKLAQAAEAPRP